MTKKEPTAGRKLSFTSTLERLADGIEYYAVPVPAKTSQALGTKGHVPVYARVNGSAPFLGSLYLKGGGRHGLRVKAEVRQEVGLKEGDRVQVQITIRDRAKEISLPPDLARTLKAEGVLEPFEAMPKGMLAFTLRRIEQAAKPETREKRIQEAVALAFERREKRR